MTDTPSLTKLVIWDWNGTLLDDTALCYGIANRMRLARGMEPLPNQETYRRLFGFPVIEYYKRMGYDLELESYEDISVEFVSEYARLVGTCSLQPHAVQTLERIRRMGVRQALLSATGEDRLFDQIALFNLTEYFDSITGGGNNLAHGKAEQAAALIAGAGVRPQEAVFIGDTDHDFEIADSIGCRCLLLTSGHQLPEYLRGLGAPLIGDLAEAPAYL